MRRRSNSRRAFTLIELLVSIGIIAVLLAILFPAISKVRQQMVVTQCASNQRQLALGVILYASANNGNIPTPRKPANQGISGWEPLLSTYLSDRNPLAETLVSKNPVGFGILYATGYVRDPRVFYERDHRNPLASYDSYNLRSGFGAAANDLVRSAYYCNPHAITSLSRPHVTTDINTRYGIQSGCALFSLAGKKPTPEYDILVMDRPSLGDSRRNHGYAWNIAFRDGSVRTFKSDEAERTINGYTVANPHVTAVWINWALHEAFINALQ